MNLFNRLEEGMMALLLAFMTLLTFVQVVLRYAFNTGLVWSLEATTYCFATLVLVGISYGVRTQAHIAVDLFVKRMSTRMHHWAALVAVVCCLGYALMMLWGSVMLVQKLYQLGNFARDLPVPKWLLTMVMPLGFGLLAMRFVEVAWQVIHRRDEAMAFSEHDPTGEASSQLFGDEKDPE